MYCSPSPVYSTLRLLQNNVGLALGFKSFDNFHNVGVVDFLQDADFDLRDIGCVFYLFHRELLSELPGRCGCAARGKLSRAGLSSVF